MFIGWFHLWISGGTPKPESVIMLSFTLMSTTKWREVVISQSKRELANSWSGDRFWKRKYHNVDKNFRIRDMLMKDYVWHVNFKGSNNVGKNAKFVTDLSHIWFEFNCQKSHICDLCMKFTKSCVYSTCNTFGLRTQEYHAYRWQQHEISYSSGYEWHAPSYVETNRLYHWYPGDYLRWACATMRNCFGHGATWTAPAAIHFQIQFSWTFSPITSITWCLVSFHTLCGPQALVALSDLINSVAADKLECGQFEACQKHGPRKK